MNKDRFIFEPYKNLRSKKTCPACKQPHTLTRYIYSDTGLPVADNVGRCDREINCGYNYTGFDFLRDKNIELPDVCKPKIIIEKVKNVSYIPQSVLNESVKDFSQNRFVKYLILLFGQKIAMDLIAKYCVGSSDYKDGCNIFWHIDADNNIRSGQITLYYANTGKRVHKPLYYPTWIHKHLHFDNFGLKLCFFGEHLLNLPENRNKPVAIVESAKTAIISSMYFKQYVWISCTMLGGLNKEKCQVLKGRNVALFPDLSVKSKANRLTAYEKWSLKAKEFSDIGNFKVADTLEKIATEEEKKQGLDVADFLVKYNHKTFIGLNHPVYEYNPDYF